MRFFNTAGPCKPELHYMLPATQRLHDENVMRLIEQQSYFVVHAPRQTGKTTAMRDLARTLTASGKYISAVVSMEVGAAFPEDVDKAEQAILADWRDSIEIQLPSAINTLLPSTSEAPAGQRIRDWLKRLSQVVPYPVVLFLDEIDALQNNVLISVLRQLRSGYDARPTSFPLSLALVGLRDVRDYKIASGGSDRLHSPSPFNIAVRSILLRNFTAYEVSTLLGQHTQETGQFFSDEALDSVFTLTQGQPWLVNALAKIATEELVPDYTQSVETIHIEQAKELLIQRRQTHLDQLTDKLRDPRVRRVIEPILAGGLMRDVLQDDRDYVIDLGLVRSANGSGLRIANSIYQEMIPRALASGPQDSLPAIKPTWLTASGQLDPHKLLDAFLRFWKQHGQPLLASAPYHEIAPHLVLMAFLHRVVNGSGSIEREYAIGTGKMDLYLRYGDVTLAMELKVWCDGKPDPLKQGLEQLDEYLSGLSLDTGWLVIFDQRSGLPDISERTSSEQAITPEGRQVVVVRG